MGMPFVHLTRVFKNNRGSALIMVIILSSVMLITGAVSTQWLRHKMNANMRAEYIAKAVLVQSKVLGLIHDDIAWRKTAADVANTANFSCLVSNSCNNTAKEFQLLDRSGQKIIDMNNPSMGFGLDGLPCQGFDAQAGNNDCPFQYKLTWVPDCLNCQKQRVRVIGEFHYKFSTDISFVKNLKIDVVRGNSNTLTDNCIAMGGQVDEKNKSKCNLPIIADACTNGHVMIGGGSADGRRVCRQLDAVDRGCPPNSAAIDFGPWGEVICAELARY